MINILSDIAILTIFHRLDFTFSSPQKITKMCYRLKFMLVKIIGTGSHNEFT